MELIGVSLYLNFVAFGVCSLCKLFDKLEKIKSETVKISRDFVQRNK